MKTDDSVKMYENSAKCFYKKIKKFWLKIFDTVKYTLVDLTVSPHRWHTIFVVLYFLI